MTWQPNASLGTLKARARLNRLVREFFHERDVMEVETPLLCRTTATDPHLRSFSVPAWNDTLYLQTSPEFCMKRLLAAGSGPIYQLCKAFRYEEPGRFHNPEFTMLEWYRPGWTLAQLLDEVELLVQLIADDFGMSLAPFPRSSYEQVFQTTLGINPHTATTSALLDCANRHINGNFADLDKNGLLDLLMSHLVEPSLPKTGIFVAEFPASQAALAQKKQIATDTWVAQRAELYLGGMEIANGYQELCDADEQRERFLQDNLERSALDLPTLPIPEKLIDALGNGFPPCAGIALGIDRLLKFIANETRPIGNLLSVEWTNL